MNVPVDPRLKTYDRLKRSFDVALGALLFGLSALPMAVIAFGIKRTSPGPVIHWSYRVGAGNRIFRMPKFRTMRTDAPAVATHLLKNPEIYVTSIGRFLRKTSLDELPQLFSVLEGQMTFVGPRPALFNQDDLIGLRTSRGVHLIKPGITGWAQINGRDELPIPVKVGYDEFYLKNRSMHFDLRIILLTLAKTFRGEGVTH
jgi:O-antigen biosynthesis protein WbqP